MANPTPIAANTAAIAAVEYPRSSPRRRPWRAITAASQLVPKAVPTMASDDGSPLQRASPRRSSAASGVTVMSAMKPVAESPTPAKRAEIDRVR